MSYSIDDLQVGQSYTMGKTVTDADIVMFAGVSTDTNAVHLNEEFAKTLPFGGRIAHGMLSASFISAVLGAHLPGPGTIYLGQTLKFTAPVRINDTVNTTVTVKEIIKEKKRVILETVCKVGDTVVITGEATVMKP
ncbi:MAG: MaoC family dehydratase [Rhodocyclaceae bacterium]